MKNFIKFLLFLFIFVIFGLIFYVGSQDLSNNETILLSIVLTIVSVSATWIASHYYSESTYKQAVEQVENENQSKLKIYALKAAEKVNNLSKELKKLSLYLEEELEQEYENTDEENHAREERIKSTIHIVGTLKSINDTALSDWQGVISEELEEQEEIEREKEEKLSNIIERYEHIISNLVHEDDTRYAYPENEELENAIKNLNRRINFIIKDFDNKRITSKTKKRRVLKEDVKNKCPICEEEIIYRQRPKKNSYKLFKCVACKDEIIGRWQPDTGFSLEKPKIINEEIECPNCKSINKIKLNSKLHSIYEDECTNCKNSFKVIRKANDLLIQPICEPNIQKCREKVTNELLDKVKSLLPPQPWPTGTHKKVAEQLNISARLVSIAISELVKRGEALVQIDGKLYIEKE